MATNFSRIELSEIFLTQGVRDTNFFNGRLLTAEDLETLQEASRKRNVQLGQAAGAGVANGLEVKLVADGSDGRPPVLEVSCGLAFNRLGQAVVLPVNAQVALAKEQSGSTQNQTTLFKPCQPPNSSGKPLSGRGAYLFLVRPATGKSGLAPRRGFGQNPKVEGCDRAVIQDGVQFRLVPFDIGKLDKLSNEVRELTILLADVGKYGSAGMAAQNKLRNWLAHVCYGTKELATWAATPFPDSNDEFFGSSQGSRYLMYGLLDHLEEQLLIDRCEVPLAMVCWTTGGVKWVDMWSVRRRMMKLSISHAWPISGNERRITEAEAAFSQFQDHIADVTRSAVFPFQLSRVRAIDNFRYLPPAGFIPVGGVNGSRGFDPIKFFDGLSTRNPVYNATSSGSEVIEPLVIEGANLEAALQQSFFYPAIDLLSSTIPSKILIWSYAVRENKMTVEHERGISPQPYLFFTSGHMPCLAEARFNVNRLNYSNYL